MRPVQTTDAHQTDRLADWFAAIHSRAISIPRRRGFSKQEITAPQFFAAAGGGDGAGTGRAGPHGGSRGVAEEVSRAIESHPRIEIRREEITAVDPSHPTIIATDR